MTTMIIVRCPHCDATLKVTAEPGEKYCNDCGGTFWVCPDKKEKK